MVKIELISFRICPFVQRAVITLRYKQVPFESTYIDLADPPAWFAEISPFGKVPLLRVDGRHVIFESAVIDEYLDEITPGALLPADALARALDRSWIEFGTACILAFSKLILATAPEDFAARQAALRDKLAWLERALSSGPWFNGEDISLVDFAYAPLFVRCRVLDMEEVLYPPRALPRIAAWARAVNDLEVVKSSVPPGFARLLRRRISARAPAAATALGIDTSTPLQASA